MYPHSLPPPPTSQFQGGAQCVILAPKLGGEGLEEEQGRGSSGMGGVPSRRDTAPPTPLWLWAFFALFHGFVCFQVHAHLHPSLKHASPEFLLYLCSITLWHPGQETKTLARWPHMYTAGYDADGFLPNHLWERKLSPEFSHAWVLAGLVAAASDSLAGLQGAG